MKRRIQTVDYLNAVAERTIVNAFRMKRVGLGLLLAECYWSVGLGPWQWQFNPTIIRLEFFGLFACNPIYNNLSSFSLYICTPSHHVPLSLPNPTNTNFKPEAYLSEA